MIKNKIIPLIIILLSTTTINLQALDHSASTQTLLNSIKEKQFPPYPHSYKVKESSRTAGHNQIETTEMKVIRSGKKYIELLSNGRKKLFDGTNNYYLEQGNKKEHSIDHSESRDDILKSIFEKHSFSVISNTDSEIAIQSSFDDLQIKIIISKTLERIEKLTLFNDNSIYYLWDPEYITLSEHTVLLSEQIEKLFILDKETFGRVTVQRDYSDYNFSSSIPEETFMIETYMDEEG